MTRETKRVKRADGSVCLLKRTGVVGHIGGRGISRVREAGRDWSVQERWRKPTKKKGLVGKSWTTKKGKGISK